MSGGIIPSQQPSATGIPRAEVTIPYQELLKLSMAQTRLEGKVDRLLDDQTEVASLRERVAKVELTQATQTGHREVWRWVIDAIWGLLLAIIAAGVFLKH